MRRLVIGLVALGLSSVCFAQGTPGTVELTPTVGYWFGDTLARGTVNQFDYDVTIDDATQYGLRLAYRFTEHWALEGTVMHGSADMVTGRKELFGGQNKIGSIDLTSGEVGFEGSFGHSRLVPFIAGGLGGMYFDPNLAGMSSDTRFSANFGGGFKLFFSPQVALRFDWRAHSVNVGNNRDNCDWWHDCSYNQDWITFKEVGLGLTFVF